MRDGLYPFPLLIACLSCLLGGGCSGTSKANNLEKAISLLHAARSHYNDYRAEHGRDEAVDEVLDLFGTDSFVEEAGSDDDAIWFEIRDGGTAYLYTKEQEDMLAAGDGATIFEASSPNLVGLGGLEQVLEQNDIDTSFVPSSEVTLDAIAGIQSDEKVLYFFGHGGHVSLQHYDQDGEFISPGSGPCMQLGQQIHTPDDLPSRWHGAWNRKLIVAKLDTANDDPVHLCIKPQFIREHVRLVNDPLVFVSTCYSGINPSLWEAFEDAGARALLGWSDQVCRYSVRDTHTRFFGYMLEDCMSVDQARNMKPDSTYAYCGPDTGLVCHCEEPVVLRAFGDVAMRFCTATTCDPECTEGDTGCTDDLRQRWYCGEAADGDACLDKVYVPCSVDDECRDAVCIETCQSVCSAGDVQCYSSTAYQECVVVGDCLQWGEPVSCPAGQTCYEGACTTECESDPGCSMEGATRCYSDTQFQECREVAPGCFKWDSPVDCPAGEVCVGPDAANACASSCTPDCDGKECGPDGCGGTCPPGCGADQTCDEASGQCGCIYESCAGACCAQGQVCLDDRCCLPQPERIAETNDADLAMDVDSSGRPHVVFRDDPSNLTYAYHDGSAWQVEATGFSGGYYVSIAVGASDRPHIAWQSGCDILHAVRDGSWIQQVVADNACGIASEPDIEIDASGVLHICYAGGGAVRLQHASNPGTWQIETVDAGGVNGLGCSIALDASNRPLISYNHLDDDDVKFARFDGASWNLEVLDADGPSANCTSMRLDVAGNPHVTYEGTGYTLRHARWTPSGWEIHMVPTQANGTHYASLDLDGAGDPLESFYESGTNELKYAAWNGAGWDVRTVDVDLGGSSYGEYHETMLRLDGAGEPWFVYNRYLGSSVWSIESARLPVCE